MTGNDQLLARPFAQIANKENKVVNLMVKQEFNAVEMAVFTCRGKDAAGQLLEGMFVCYLKDWPRKKQNFINAGIKIKEL